MRNTVFYRTIWIALLCCCLSQLGHSAERSFSSYIPAYYGDYGVALPPKPGFSAYATTYNFSGDVAGDGPAPALDLKAHALILGFQYVDPEKILGATFAVGAYTALIDGTLTIKDCQWHNSEAG